MTKPRKPAQMPLLSPQLIALILIVLAIALVVVWMVSHRPTAPATAPVSTAGALPDRTLTPGAVDPGATDANICAHDWGAGAPPEPGAGDSTYSKAARHTSSRLKDAVFAEYHLTNPHDGGHSWEVDHLVPLSLGGRDVRENLWPESRTGDGMNAWTKDRLEYHLYRMVCDPAPGTPRLPLAEAQAAFRTDWVAAWHHYCANEADCPDYHGD
jgi:hypothetical protein